MAVFRCEVNENEISKSQQKTNSSIEKSSMLSIEKAEKKQHMRTSKTGKVFVAGKGAGKMLNQMADSKKESKGKFPVYVSQKVEDNSGHEFKVMNVSKDYNDVAMYDESGAMKAELNEEYIDEDTIFVAVDSREHGRAVYIYGEGGVTKVEEKQKENNTEDKLKEIDFNPLEKKLKDLTGFYFSDSNLKYSLSDNPRISGAIKIDSDNLVDQAGIFQAAIKDVRVQTFNTDYNAETNKYWISIDLRYESKDGGSNGMRVLDAWYDAGEKSWQFREAA